jgi:sugar (pentulose or hexulose) kinase
MSTDEIFAATGYEPWAIASLFQLLSMQRDGSPLLDVAGAFLNMPDLINCFLTGRKASERSIINTSNLMGTDRQWSEEIIKRFSLPRRMFQDIIEPGTVLGEMLPDVQDETGVRDVPVVAVAGHDTSAAVAAVPAEGDNWAFISCGTWSIPGCLIDEPIATPRCLELGFTNEYTVGGWYLARNVSGLWPIQQLRAKWDRQDDPWDYSRIVAEASAAGRGPLMDVADEALMAPPDMEEALLALVGKGGQTAPESRGELAYGALESLALEYDRRLRSIAELTGRSPDTIHMVGGGIKNELLCQLTADACGAPVHAAADQCTALGNALGQAVALGVLTGPEDIREVMRASFAAKVYEPVEAAEWQDKRGRYAEITGGAG